MTSFLIRAPGTLFSLVFVITIALGLYEDINSYLQNPEHRNAVKYILTGFSLIILFIAMKNIVKPSQTSIYIECIYIFFSLFVSSGFYYNSKHILDPIIAKGMDSLENPDIESMIIFLYISSEMGFSEIAKNARMFYMENYFFCNIFLAAVLFFYLARACQASKK